MPSKWTWSRAAIESGPSYSARRQPPSWKRQCLDPTQSSSVLSMLNLSRFADIQWVTSAIHHSSWAAADVVSVQRQWRYNCVLSANACRDTPCFSAMSARSAVYTLKNSGPSTDPWGRADDVDNKRCTATKNVTECSAGQIWSEPLQHDAT